MQDRHTNKQRYFKEQGETTNRFVIPFVSDHVRIEAGARVLEIGCGEGGNLTPFLDRGCEVVGVDISPSRIDNARKFMAETYPDVSSTFIYRDIYDVTTDEIGQFDLIFLRDVIEHIHNQERFMAFVKRFLKPEGHIFFGFPPWMMPFGGHQQICKSKLGAKLPWYHVLPKFMYRGMLKLFGESPKRIEDLLEIKETGISTYRFLKIARTENYQVKRKTYYFINPNYQTKFGLKPRKQTALITWIPGFRDLFTTCMYCLIGLGEEDKKS